MTRVGFIGLGSQGGPMARRIAESGHPTTLWARRAATLEPYADTGAATANSAAELAKESDVVCVCVVDDAGVEEVVAGPDGVLSGLAAGTVLVVHSTVHPQTCRRLATRAALQGVALVDAPVSGGGHAAAARHLLVMAGGEPDAVERCRPVFQTYGDPVIHLGPVGSGQVAKILNNLLMAANLGTAEGAYALGRRFDLDLAQLGEVFAHGTAESFSGKLLNGGDFTAGRMSEVAGPLLQKDVRLLVELADAAGARPGAVLTAADSALSSMKHPR